MTALPSVPPRDLTTISRACYEGNHKHCGRQIFRQKATKDGNIYLTCTCEVCQHVPDLRRRPADD